MTTTTTGPADTTHNRSAQIIRAETARRLYEAEWALHCAHQTGIDAWIAAASDHLHEAVRDYLLARGGTTPAARGTCGSRGSS
jgi:hypothetical protein